MYVCLLHVIYQLWFRSEVCDLIRCYCAVPLTACTAGSDVGRVETDLAEEVTSLRRAWRESEQMLLAQLGEAKELLRVEEGRREELLAELRDAKGLGRRDWLVDEEVTGGLSDVGSESELVAVEETEMECSVAPEAFFGYQDTDGYVNPSYQREQEYPNNSDTDESDGEDAVAALKSTVERLKLRGNLLLPNHSIVCFLRCFEHCIYD